MILNLEALSFKNLLSFATIFYDLVLFGAICSFFVPFAPVSCCFLRCVADCAFCHLSSPKMVPKCSPEASKYLQNRPKIDPKLPPGAPWAHQVEPKSYFFVLGSILEPNLVPLGTQNRPKNRYFARKTLQEARLQSNVCLARCITSFFIPFLVIFGQKSMKKTSRCCASCWCVPPLKNHVFYRLPCLRTVFLQIC